MKKTRTTSQGEELVALEPVGQSKLVLFIGRNPIVSHQRVRENEDLPRIRWICEGFGISDHSCVEHNLTRHWCACTKGVTLHHGAICEFQVAFTTIVQPLKKVLGVSVDWFRVHRTPTVHKVQTHLGLPKTKVRCVGRTRSILEESKWLRIQICIWSLPCTWLRILQHAFSFAACITQHRSNPLQSKMKRKTCDQIASLRHFHFDVS